jgi:hypothetical protein
MYVLSLPERTSSASSSTSKIPPIKVHKCVEKLSLWSPNTHNDFLAFPESGHVLAFPKSGHFLAFPKSFWGLVGFLKPPYHCIDLVSSPQKSSQHA